MGVLVWLGGGRDEEELGSAWLASVVAEIEGDEDESFLWVVAGK